jgi:hypothetical protein
MFLSVIPPIALCALAICTTAARIGASASQNCTSGCKCVCCLPRQASLRQLTHLIDTDGLLLAIAFCLGRIECLRIW